MRSAIIGLTLLLAAASLAGCTASAAKGSASVYVKDAPSDDFDEVHVVFTDVLVKAEGNEHDDGQGDDDRGAEDGQGNGDDADGADEQGAQPDDGEGPEWTTVFHDDQGVDVDLLSANGTKAAFLGESDLPAGEYEGLRVVVKEAYGIQNGTRVPIALSSGVLKVQHDFEVGEDRETRLVLDFDVDRSLVQEGDGDWRMTPVLKSVSDDDVDDDASGEEHGDHRGDVRDLDEDDGDEHND